MDGWIDMGEGDAVTEKEGDREDRGGRGRGEACEEGEGEERGKEGGEEREKKERKEGRLWGRGGRVCMRCCLFYCGDEREKDGRVQLFRSEKGKEGKKRRRRSGDSRGQIR